VTPSLNGTALSVDPFPFADSGGALVTEIVIFGTTTQNTYADVVFANNIWFPVTVPIFGMLDATLRVTVKTNFGVTGNTNIAAVHELLGSGVQPVSGVPGQPLPVQVLTPTFVTSKAFSVSLANAATANIVLASAPTGIYVYGWHMTVGPAGVPAAADTWMGTLQNTAGTVIVGRVRNRLLTVAGQGMVYGGEVVEAGLFVGTLTNLVIAAATGSATNVQADGVVHYAQF
jgi:hypothetical protein